MSEYEVLVTDRVQKVSHFLVEAFLVERHDLVSAPVVSVEQIFHKLPELLHELNRATRIRGGFRLAGQ